MLSDLDPQPVTAAASHKVLSFSIKTKVNVVVGAIRSHAGTQPRNKAFGPSPLSKFERIVSGLC